MATDFIDAFRRLQAHERGPALHTLTTVLSPYEWRALHAATSGRTFQLDVVGSLPVELVAQIFGLLDPATPYRLQSVSRQWRNTLQSLHVLKASLNQWYQGTVNLQDADYASCKMKARAIHAFRTGKPSRIYKITSKQHDDSDSMLPSHSIFDFRLVGNSLIWQHAPSRRGDPSRCACVLDLDTWHFRVLSGEACEQIVDVFASSEIVVLTTHTSICYVHELQGKQGCKKFRVPNSNYFKRVACRGRTVACVAHLNDHISVYIWEYDSQRGRSFEIRHELGTIFSDQDSLTHGPSYIAPLLQPKTQTIIIFNDDALHDTRPSQTQRQLAFSRYTYSGQCLSTHYPSLPGVWSIIQPVRPATYSFVPVDYNESILAIHMRQQVGADIRRSASLLLRFNEEDNDLSVWQDSRFQGKQGSSRNSMAWWRDTCYGDAWSEEAKQRDMIAQMGTSDVRRYMPIVSESMAIKRRNNWIEPHSPIVMNDKYMVRNTVYHFYILCFGDDDKGQWPKESGPFLDMWNLEMLKTTGD